MKIIHSTDNLELKGPFDLENVGMVICLLVPCPCYNVVLFPNKKFSNENVKTIKVMDDDLADSLTIDISDHVRHDDVSYEILKFISIGHSEDDVLEVEMQAYPAIDNRHRIAYVPPMTFSKTE